MDSLFEPIDDSMSDTSSVKKKPLTRSEDTLEPIFKDNLKKDNEVAYECSQMCTLYGCQYEAILHKNIELETKIQLLEVKQGLNCTTPLIDEALQKLTNGVSNDKTKTNTTV